MDPMGYTESYEVHNGDFFFGLEIIQFLFLYQNSMPKERQRPYNELHSYELITTVKQYYDVPSMISNTLH